jgi:hypothetical protein
MRRIPAEPGHPEIQSIGSAPVRKGRGALYATAAGIAVLAVAGGALLFRKGAVQVMVDTVPAGARALQGGREVGVTPVPMALKAGDSLHFEKKGFRPMDFRFQGGEAPKVKLEALLTEETIRTYPDGATVVMDAVKLEGTTPLTVKNWDQSLKHDITCTKGDLGLATTFNEGEAPGSQVFTLVPASQTRAGAQPKAVDVNAPGTLRFSASYAVRVRMDGKEMGEVREGGTLSVPPGNHKLELTNLRVFLKESQTVNVSPGQGATVGLPGLCNLIVNTFPNSGTVVVDGVATSAESDGSTPIQVVKGRHSVNVQGRSGAPQSVDLTGDFKLNMRF